MLTTPLKLWQFFFSRNGCFSGIVSGEEISSYIQGFRRSWLLVTKHTISELRMRHVIGQNSVSRNFVVQLVENITWVATLAVSRLLVCLGI